MKKIFLLFISLSITNLYADQIYLKNNKIIKGKVIQITDKNIEYNPENGARVFDVVPKDEIYKIIYDNGKEVKFAYDNIYRTNGDIIKGTIIQITKETITYRKEGSEQEESIKRDDVERIVYKDGKEIEIKKGIDAKIENKVPIGGFIDSIIHISGVYGFSNHFGDVINKEKRVFGVHQLNIISAYGLRDYYIRNYALTPGCELDLMLPAIKFVQKRGFDFTGIKFGIKGKYGYEITKSIIYYQNYYSNEYGYHILKDNSYMHYKFWGVGPEMNFLFSPRNNVINFIINFYALYSKIFAGDYSAAPAVRHAGFYINDRNYNTKFNGYSLRFGLGPQISLNRWFPMTLGVNLTYSHTNLNFNRQITIYNDGTKGATLHEWGGEISFGFHI